MRVTGGSTSTGASGGNVDGGTGGEMSSGATAGTGGSEDTGGTGGIGGETPTGGESGTGGNSATGGTGGTPTECVDGPTGTFTDVGTTKGFDNFKFDWPALSNGVSAWDGFWSGAGDDGVTAADSLIPFGDSLEWEAGRGYAKICDAEDYALHIHATGSDEWGVSVSAQFTGEKTDVDLSAYDGVVFWVRSDNKSLLKIAYATAAAPLVDIGTEPVQPLGAGWDQRTMAFPTVAAFDPAEVALIKFIGVAPNGEDTIDIWIENVTFYTDPAE